MLKPGSSGLGIGCIQRATTTSKSDCYPSSLRSCWVSSRCFSSSFSNRWTRRLTRWRQNSAPPIQCAAVKSTRGLTRTDDDAAVSPDFNAYLGGCAFQGNVSIEFPYRRFNLSIVRWNFSEDHGRRQAGSGGNLLALSDDHRDEQPPIPPDARRDSQAAGMAATSGATNLDPTRNYATRTRRRDRDVQFLPRNR